MWTIIYYQDSHSKMNLSIHYLYSHYHKTKTLISLGIWTKIEVLPDADDQTSHKVYGYLPKGGSPFKIKDKKEK